MGLTLKQVQQKLYEKLEPSGWARKLRGFLLSEEFLKILIKLNNETKAKNRFTPELKYVFRAFTECPYKDLKVVIVGQDPYPQIGSADGIAFSCSRKDKVEKSLKYILTEVEATVYPDGMEWDQDLVRWSNQGVLMLNTALTCRIGKIGSHFDIWEPFMQYLFDTLDKHNSGTLYAFLGNEARKWSKNISANNYRFFAPHPASAVYQKQSRWNSGNLFNNINAKLEDLYGADEIITW